MNDDEIQEVIRNFLKPRKPQKRTVKLLAIYALEGFSAEMQTIKIIDNVFIKKMPVKERKAFYTKVESMIAGGSVDELMKHEYFLYFHTSATYYPSGAIDISEYDAPARKGLELFKLHFRLFQDKNIRIRFYSKQLYSELHNKYVPAGMAMSSSNQWATDGDYVLTRKQLNNFRKRFRTLLSFDLEHTKLLNVAAKRFNFSYERYDWEDKIIDMMIGFEALFVAEQSEISYRLALRASKFIGNKKSTREIFDFVKNCYNLRSKIVHGVVLKKEADQIKRYWEEENTILKLRDLLRQAIIKCINDYNPDTIKNLISDIDQKILL